MEVNIQELLNDKYENVVQFNVYNNTSSPIALNLFDTASLTTVPTSGNQFSTYSVSSDLAPILPSSFLQLNPTNGLILAGELGSSNCRIVNSLNNTVQNNFDNSNGFNGDTKISIIQPDGKILICGSFTAYKGASANRIIRLNSDGSIDLTFDNSIGFNSFVFNMALQSDGKIVVVGQFTSYKGVTANRIIRLNSDGSIDLTFDNSIGFNTSASIVQLQSDGKIIVGGAFSTYKGVSANRIIRLNTNGTIDASFVYGTGFNSLFGVIAIAIQTDGKILVGGDFTLYQGLTNNKIIRLNSNGSKDVTFDNSIGFDIGFGLSVNFITLQPDGKIICFGNFTTYKGVSANRIIRLNTVGSKDVTFDNSIGFNGSTLSGTLQTDGKILVIGQFTTYKGITAENIIRLNSDGSIDVTFDNSIGLNTRGDYISLLADGSMICTGLFTSYKGFINNRIVKLNSSGNILSVLELGSETYTLSYCPINNFFYTSPSITHTNNDIYIISGDGKYVVSSIPLPLSTQNANSVQYNASNNSMYFIIQDLTLSQGKILVLDCSSNTFVATINLPSFDNSFALSNPSSSNQIYYFDNSTGFLQKIDCNTNTLLLINLPLPNLSNGVSSLNFNSTNNQMYCMYELSNYVDIVDTLTDTAITSINIPAYNNFNTYFSAINPVTNQLFITNFVNTTKKIAVIDCNTNTLNSVQILSNTTGQTTGVIYNSFTASMYVSGSLFSVVTFSATPFFISGSVNYNTFVNSLISEPIFVDEIRLLTQNQIQLYNELQLTKIDSNGNQIFFPEFPITKVDSYQSQGNIAGIKLYGLVFDGFTYVYQYVVNPFEVVSFEVYYKQLDRFSATITFPIFFKPKIQLKEYIKKELNL